jgi:hypothetical protein
VVYIVQVNFKESRMFQKAVQFQKSVRKFLIDQNTKIKIMTNFKLTFLLIFLDSFIFTWFKSTVFRNWWNLLLLKSFYKNSKFDMSFSKCSTIHSSGLSSNWMSDFGLSYIVLKNDSILCAHIITLVWTICITVVPFMVSQLLMAWTPKIKPTHLEISKLNTFIYVCWFQPIRLVIQHHYLVEYLRFVEF